MLFMRIAATVAVVLVSGRAIFADLSLDGETSGSWFGWVSAFCGALGVTAVWLI